MKFKSIGEVQQALDAIPTFAAAGSGAANFSLDAMRAICKEMGHPEQAVPMIHVAGTNGKGSVCRMLASIYQSAGYRTGLYTSPHLVRFNERFHLNGAAIPDHELIRFFNSYWAAIQEIGLSYFEIATALAFWWFAEEEADLVLLETGLGGRLDATNVVDPLLSIIVSIGHDHEALLGPGIANIAAEKAGIIKPGAPVLIGRIEETARAVIKARAEETKSPFHDLTDISFEVEEGRFHIETPQQQVVIEATGWKPIQAHNAALAVRATELLGGAFPVSKEELQNGLTTTFARFPHHGSFHLLTGEHNWYYDGGHNPEAMATTVEAMKRIAPLEEWQVIYSLMRDKVKPELVEMLLATQGRWYVEQEGDRAARFSEISALDPEARPLPTEGTLRSETLEELKGELVLFAGSFYFYSRVKAWIDSL